MKVTKQNYERFLIDLMDGKLAPSMEESLFAFLEENPEIKAEFDDLDIINSAVDGDVSFNLKSALKKPQILASESINEDNYEEFFIASSEDDLSVTQEMELSQFITLNPQLAKIHHQFNQAKAQADLTIEYPNKKTLKRYPFYQRKIWYYSASAAASILLLLSILFFNKSEVQIKQIDFAKIDERITVPKKMNSISKKITINSTAEVITPNFRSIRKLTIADNKDFIITDQKIRRLQARVDIKEQLSALQTKFRPTRFLLPKDFKTKLIPPQYSNQTNYAQEDGKNKRIVSAIWKGLFANNKTKVREDEGGSDKKNTKNIGPLWVLANIGLERVNEITGTNMRLNSRVDGEKDTGKNERLELEISRSMN